MWTYTVKQARQHLDIILNVARDHGEVRIKSDDGREYVVMLVTSPRSPFEIAGVDLQMRASEIVDFVREGRG